MLLRIRAIGRGLRAGCGIKRRVNNAQQPVKMKAISTISPAAGLCRMQIRPSECAWKMEIRVNYSIHRP